MTLTEAIDVHSPAWVGIWLNILLAGAFILPLALLIWKPTRMTAVLCVVASVAGGVGVGLLYERVGYVKLLGLPHVIFWTPLAIYLWTKIRSPELSNPPRIIIGLILATITISLAFDYADVIRYALGERTPLAMPA